MSDLIDRQAAIADVKKYGSIWMQFTDDMSREQVAEEALKASKNSMIRILNDLPSAEPKKGTWENYIADTGVEHWRVIRCSECGKVAIDRYNYCPNCGADMREEK